MSNDSCSASYDITSFDLSVERWNWDLGRQETKSLRYDIAMFELTLPEGKEVMYGDEMGPHVSFEYCTSKNGTKILGDWRGEHNHHKRERRHLRGVSQEQTALPFRQIASRNLNAEATPAPTPDGSGGGDDYDGYGGYGGGGDDYDGYGGYGGGGDYGGGDHYGGGDDYGGGGDDGLDIPECLIACAGFKEPRTCSVLSKIMECAEGNSTIHPESMKCAPNNLTKSKAIADPYLDCLCNNNAAVCQQIGTEPVSAGSLVSPEDWVSLYELNLAHLDTLVMPGWKNDPLAKYFRVMYNNDDDYQTSTFDRFSAFFDVNVEYDKEKNACVPYVKLEETDEEMVEVISVDGIDMTCMIAYAAGYYQQLASSPFYEHEHRHRATHFYDNDPLTVLRNSRKWSRLITGDAFPTALDDEEVTVVVRYANGTVSKRSTSATFRKWTMLEDFNHIRRSFLHGKKCSEMPVAVRNGQQIFPGVSTHGNGASFEFEMPSQCPRVGGQRIEKNSKAEFASDIDASKLVVGVVMRSRIIETGEEELRGYNEDFSTAAHCSVRVENVYDQDANPIESICDLNNFKPKPNTCSHEKMKDVAVTFRHIMDNIKDGTVPAKVEVILLLLAADAWKDCFSLVNRALKFKDKMKTVETTLCAAQYGTPAFLNDPCCNHDLARSKCCAPRNISYPVPVANVDTSELALNCANDMGQLAVAIFASKNYVATRERSLDPSKGCAVDLRDSVSRYVKLIDVGRKCGNIIRGDESMKRGDNGLKSSATCTIDADCYTKKCLAATDGGTERYCQTSEDPRHFASCLLGELKDAPKAREKVRYVFGGHSGATVAEIGQGILDIAGRERCTGPDGWRYDPDHHNCKHWNKTTYECDEYWCTDTEDCKSKCLASGYRCNWNSHDKTLTQGTCETQVLGGKFCGECWGRGAEDCYEVSRDNKCLSHFGSSEWTTDQCKAFLGTTNATLESWDDHHSSYDKRCGLNVETEAECYSAQENCTAVGFREQWACVKDLPSSASWNPYYHYYYNSCDEYNNNTNNNWEDNWHEHHLNEGLEGGSEVWVGKCMLWLHNSERNNENYTTAHCPSDSTPTMVRSAQKACSEYGGLLCYAPNSRVPNQTACQDFDSNNSNNSTYNVHWNSHFQKCIVDQQYVHHDDYAASQAFVDQCNGVDDGQWSIFRGITFKPGRWNTEEKCTQGVCDIDKDLNAEQCQQTAECTAYSCQGCNYDWWKRHQFKETGQDEAPWSVCYVEGKNSTECTDLEEGAYLETNFSVTSPVCVLHTNREAESCSGDNYTWSDCSSMPISDCTNFPENNVSRNMLMCAPTNNARCKTEADCESSGYCEGGLRSNYWFDGRHHYKPYVCVAPAHVSHGHVDCKQYVSNETDWDGIESWHWMEKCILLKLTEPECNETSGAVWTSTVETQEDCKAKKRCQWNPWSFNDMNAQECSTCKREMKSPMKWHGSEWKNGSMTDGYLWLNRSWTKKNSWTVEPDRWIVEWAVANVIESLYHDLQSVYMSCMYSELNTLIQKIACVCGVDESTCDSSDAFGDLKTLISNTTAYPNAPEVAGMQSSTRVEVKDDSVQANSTNQIALSSHTFIPNANSTAIQRRTNRFLRGLEEEKSLDASDCQTVVKNNDGYLVGQLIGNCVEVEFSESMANPVFSCFDTQTSIEINPLFNVFGFAIYDPNEKSYTANDVVAIKNGDQLCLDLMVTSYICPSARVANPETVTEDQAEGGCSYLSDLVEVVRLTQMCSAGNTTACDIVGIDDPNDQSPTKESGGLSTALIIGIAAGSGVLALAGIFFYCYCKKRTTSRRGHGDSKRPKQLYRISSQDEDDAATEYSDDGSDD